MKRITLLLVSFIFLLVVSSSKASEDLSWSAQSSNVLAKFSSVFFVNEKRGWAAGSNGALLATEDGGASWSKVALPERQSKEAINDLWFFDERRGCLLGEYGMYNRLPGTVWTERVFLLASKDGGANWIPGELSQSQPLPARSGVSGRALTKPEGHGPEGQGEDKPEEKPQRPPDAVLTRMSFAGDRYGWACGETGTIQSTRNGGATWQLQFTATKRLLYDVAAIDEKHAVIAGAGGTILQTVDGGRTWLGRATNVTETLRALHFVDAKTGWAAGSKGVILATADGGSTWQAQKSNVTNNLNDVFFVTAKEGWAAGDRGLLLRTTDGGATWEPVELNTRSNLSRLFFIAPDRGWVVGASGAIFKYGPGEGAQRISLVRSQP
jgi:photosystem II stability/assembly factor-like uncharacterized protein